MNAKHLIVVYGYDVALTKTRLLILDNAGFKSLGVYTVGDLVHALCTSAVALVILGHSLAPEDMASALSMANRVAKSVPVLRLAVFPLLKQINHEVVLDVSKGPYRLIDAVHNLTQQ